MKSPAGFFIQPGSIWAIYPVFLPTCATAAVLAVLMNQVEPTQPNGA
jgi:hypothetical protein